MTIENDGPLSLEEAASTYADSEDNKSITEELLPEDEDIAADEPDAELSEDDELGEEDGEQEDEQELEEEPEDEDSELPDVIDDYQISVKLKDGTTASIQDLINGNERQSDYTRKSQDLAQQRTAFEQEAQRVKQFEEQVHQQQQFVTQTLQSFLPPVPDETLLDPNSPKYDPLAFQSQQYEYGKKVQSMQEAEQLYHQDQQRRQGEAQQEAQKKQEALYSNLYERKPELREPQKLQEYETSLRTGMIEAGYSAEDMSGINDPRMLQYIEDAHAFRALKAKSKQPAKKQKRPPVTRGRKRSSPSQQSAKQKRVAMDRLSKTGNLNDGVSALMALDED